MTVLILLTGLGEIVISLTLASVSLMDSTGLRPGNLSLPMPRVGTENNPGLVAGMVPIGTFLVLIIRTDASDRPGAGNRPDTEDRSGAGYRSGTDRNLPGSDQEYRYW